MKLTRRDAIKVSGTAVAGLSMGVVKPDRVLAQEAQEFPESVWWKAKSDAVGSAA